MSPTILQIGASLLNTQQRVACLFPGLPLFYAVRMRTVVHRSTEAARSYVQSEKQIRQRRMFPNEVSCILFSRGESFYSEC